MHILCVCKTHLVFMYLLFIHKIIVIKTVEVETIEQVVYMFRVVLGILYIMQCI